MRWGTAKASGASCSHAQRFVVVPHPDITILLFVTDLAVLLSPSA